MTCAVWSKTCSTLVWLRASPKSHCLRNRNIFSHLLKTFLPRSEGQLTQFYQNARAKPSPKRRMPNKNNFKLNWAKGCGSFGDRRPDEARAISTKTMGFPHVPAAGQDSPSQGGEAQAQASGSSCGEGQSKGQWQSQGQGQQEKWGGVRSQYLKQEIKPLFSVPTVWNFINTQTVANHEHASVLKCCFDRPLRG